MKTIKVSEATPIQLDWLVAKAQDTDPDIYQYGGRPALRFEHELYSPSANPGQAYPIVYRECIATYASGACSIAPKNPDYWVAEILDTSEMITQYGPTPLIAAMRCYVASKLGDEVEIPEELI